MPVKFSKLPFNEAIEYLKQKVNLPTDAYTDLQKGMHSRAFVIAGAKKDQLLADIRGEIDRALKEGTTLHDFKKNFVPIIKKHGWSFKQSIGWRSAVIYNTNLRVAYSAGSEAQMQKTMSTRPFARYIGGLSENPRQNHLALSGTVLPLGHAFWRTWTPPNGWGCKCKKVSVSKRELERDGRKVSKAPKIPTRKVKNPATGKTEDVPVGIDPGWNYNPGRAAWGTEAALRSMRQFRKRHKALESLTPGNWKTQGRPERVPVDISKAKLDHSIPRTKGGMEKALNKILGGEEKIFSFNQGKFRHDFNVNAKALAEHLEKNTGRAPLLPLLNETLEDPFEVWQSFERHKESGKVVLRTRFIKAVDTGKKGEGLLFVADAANGQMRDLTFIPFERLSQLNNERRGKLVYSRKD